MATALTAGRIYILNWAPAGDDSDAYDLEDGTEGTDWVQMRLPIKIVDVTSTKKEPRDFPGGSNYIKAKGYYATFINVQGVLVESSVTLTMEKVKWWKKFLFKEKTDDDLYLVIKWAAGIYWPFWDTNDDDVREYSEGAPVRDDITFRWFHNKQFFVQLGFNWKESW